MKDFLGVELIIGDFVATLHSDNTTPAIYQVRRFTPKKVELTQIYNNGTGALQSRMKFPIEVIKLDNEQAKKFLRRRPRDLLGNRIVIGDYVFISDGKYIDPIIGVITEFSPGGVTVKRIVGNTYREQMTRLQNDVIKIDPHLLTMYALTKEHDDEV